MTDKQRAAVEAKAQAVLDIRAQYLAPGGTSYTSPTSERSEASGASINSAGKAKSGTRVTRPSEMKSATLADLYDPLAMPPELLRAHAELDRAVEKCDRSEPFHSDRQRVEFLFALYEKLTAPLLSAAGRPRRKKSVAP